MIFNVTGGCGGTGATLTVTAPAGCTVTVSKDGKTKTKTAGADGVAVFKGLKSGQWTVTITDGSQTAQKTVTITADYSTAITFFSATIHVTYPAGSTCTATDGTTTLTAPDTSGAWDCVVPNAGAWTVHITDGTKNMDKTVPITENGQSASAELSYVYYMVKDGVLKSTFSTYSSGSGDFTVTQADGYVSFVATDAGNQSAWAEIDLTQYNTLTIIGTGYAATGSTADRYKFGVWTHDTAKPQYNNFAASSSITNGTMNKTLDISSLSGVYLVGLTTLDKREQKITGFYLE